jgi:predicted nucleotidyltransferase
MSHHVNIVRIKVVANALDTLKEKVVFVGGATISLYPDKPVLEVRPTDDVDVIIEILNYKNRVEVEEKLRAIGFTNDIQSGVVCRFQIQGIVVDIMPTNDPSIGFGNRWYPEGFNEAVDYVIDDRCTVKILSAPYFIATKLEAFKGRGRNDGRTSSDFEDIIYVLENRKEIWKEMIEAKKELQDYLKFEFENLLKNSNIEEWIDCHVEKRYPVPTTEFIFEKLNSFCYY